jgi:hypothetical protein
VKGGEFNDAAFRRLKPVLQGQAKGGWFQGSVFFSLLGESLLSFVRSDLDQNSSFF